MEGFLIGVIYKDKTVLVLSVHDDVSKKVFYLVLIANTPISPSTKAN